MDYYMIFIRVLEIIFCTIFTSIYLLAFKVDIDSQDFIDKRRRLGYILASFWTANLVFFALDVTQMFEPSNGLCYGVLPGTDRSANTVVYILEHVLCFYLFNIA
jgi:hypothetical protein